MCCVKQIVLQCFIDVVFIFIYIEGPKFLYAALNTTILMFLYPKMTIHFCVIL